MRPIKTTLRVVAPVACLTLAVSPVLAQIDHLATVINTTNATGGNSIASFGYDPTTDTAYASGFGAGATLRRITNVTSGTQVSTVMVSETQLQLYYREGDPTRGVSTALQSGMIFNPAAVGIVPAFGNIWITDSGFTRLPGGSSTTDPTVTKRIYRYNLQPVGPAAVPPPPYGDGRDVFTTVVTLEALRTASGGGTGSDNFGRQSAFSPTGQTLYSIDSSTAHGGVYKVDPIAGTTSRIFAASGINTEPAVVRIGSTDRIHFQGAGTNDGGVSYVDHDGTTTTGQQVLLTKTDLTNFFERPTITPDVRSMAADAAGNLYFNDIASSVVVRRDAQGRLSKVATRNERDQALTGTTLAAPAPNANTLRMQAFAAVDPTAGAVTKIFYAESTPVNQVAAMTVYLPADFNRDGLQDVADLTLLKSKLTFRGVGSPLADARYNLNGNEIAAVTATSTPAQTIIDWKDVKLVQQFIPFKDGDADLNLGVNFADLLTLAQNYGDTSVKKKWTDGDFDGDETVAFPDLLALAQNYESTPGGTFASDWSLAQAMVPEPTAAAAMAVLSALAMRRGGRRRSRPTSLPSA